MYNTCVLLYPLASFPSPSSLPVFSPRLLSLKVGIIWGDTGGDCERFNAEHGLNVGDEGWKDPDHAPAVVVPGSTFDTQTPQTRWDDILSRNQVRRNRFIVWRLCCAVRCALRTLN